MPMATNNPELGPGDPESFFSEPMGRNRSLDEAGGGQIWTF